MKKYIIICIVIILLTALTLYGVRKEPISDSTTKSITYNGSLKPEIKYVYPTPVPEPKPNILNYTWKIEYKGNGEGGDDIHVIEFINTGTTNIKSFIIKIEMFKASGDFYTSRKFDIGSIEPGQTVKKSVSIPSRYYGLETWSTSKFYTYNEIEGWKEQKMESTYK